MLRLGECDGLAEGTIVSGDESTAIGCYQHITNELIESLSILTTHSHNYEASCCGGTCSHILSTQPEHAVLDDQYFNSKEPEECK